MRVLLLVVVALLALSCLADAKPSSSSISKSTGMTLTAKKPSKNRAEFSKSWLKAENKKWPRWGGAKARWLKHELKEAKKDLADSRVEKKVVNDWAVKFIKNRSNEFESRINNRRNECESFTRLLNIRSGNFKFHQGVHRSIVKGRFKKRKNPLSTKKSKKGGKIRNKNFKLKFSTHARMMITSRTRLTAAKAAVARCKKSVRRLKTRKAKAKSKAKAVTTAARNRSQAHVRRVKKIVAKIQSKLKAHRTKVRARVAKYKTRFFHSCKRVRRYKYKCFMSNVHGKPAAIRRRFRFFKCFYNKAKANGVKFTCYK